MKKDRVAAFTDAVLAIIMTILVLELEKPSTPTLSALWELRHSVFSYATDLVSGDFNNRVTQGFYGIFVMLVTLSNIWLSKTLDKADSDMPREIMAKRRRLLWVDIAIKVVGLIVSVTVYPPAMMYSVIIAAAFLMISIHKMKLDWSDN